MKLDVFFKFSGLIFSFKEKMVGTRNWLKILFFALLIIILELVFAVVSFPVYLVVSPARIQEDFPKYKVRRKINLTTFLGAGFLFLVKILFVGIFSFYILGGQALLATSQSWTFDNPDNYVYDEGIEIADGTARLKDLETPAPGETTNQGFDGGVTGWAFSRWGSNIGQSGAYNPIGGNPGGYAEVRMRTGSNQEGGGYFEQEIVVEATDIYSITLNLDWNIDKYGAPADSLHLYAFVDDFSGEPTIGTEVWDSGNQTGVIPWTSIDQIDLGITDPGTYYLKVGLWLDYSADLAAYDGGFDNIALEWDGIITPIYADDRPTIYPTSSLNAPLVINWDSFTETAVKNGGEIYYQLSDDDGSIWQYWDGLAWATAGATNYNTATTVNDNIGTFPVAERKITWKAFLESDSTQQVILDNIEINYTEDELPVISNLAPQQSTTTGLVYIDYDLQDNESDPVDIAAYEYSLTGDFLGEEATMTIADDPEHSGISGLVTSPGGLPYTFVWDAQADAGDIATSTVYVRMRADDGIGVGPYASSSAFAIDYKAPQGLSEFSFSSVGNDIVLTWSIVSDDNFNRYEIWHGSSLENVNNRTANQLDDPALTDVNTSETTLSLSSSLTAGYYIKIWAIDDFGNESTLGAINVYVPPPAPTGGGGGGYFTPPDTTPPVKPILDSLESPVDSTTITISGSTEPYTRIDLYNRGVFVSRLISASDSNGNFSQVFEFNEGSYVLTVKAVDFSNNESVFSDPVNLAVSLIVPPSVVSPPVPAEAPETEAPEIVTPLTPPEIEVIAPVTPIPTQVEVVEVIETAEQSVIVPAPEIANINLAAANNLISFTGTALPNKDVMVYIRSEQAVVYNTRANQQGIWKINHSQENIELAPGQHSIFAMTVDKAAKIKSQASTISLFTIEKSLWVSLYNLLNLWTTVIALIIIIMTVMWLYRLRKSPA